MKAYSEQSFPKTGSRSTGGKPSNEENVEDEMGESGRRETNSARNKRTAVSVLVETDERVAVIPQREKKGRKMRGEGKKKNRE